MPGNLNLGGAGGYGPTSPVPKKTYKFYTGEAVTAGMVVRWAHSTEVDDAAAVDARAVNGNVVCQSDANTVPMGVALDTAAAEGAVIRVQVQGVCTVTTNADDDIAAGVYLIAAADGTCDSSTTPDECLLGVALEDDVNAADTVEALIFPTGAVGL